MVWYSHLSKNFPQFVVIRIVKGFSVVNEAEVDVFLEFSCFLYDLANFGNLISSSSAFSKLSLYIIVHLELLSSCTVDNLDCTILSIILLACEMSAIVP